MKKFIKYLMVMLILPVAILTSGCTGTTKEAVSIKDIEKTDSVGLVDTYTVTYTNGTTSEFTIVNGEDGANLYNNITINDLYNQVKDNKPVGYSLIDFINEYLDIKLDIGAVSSSTALRSAVSIYVEHEVSIVDYNNITGYNPITGNTYGVKNSIAWSGGSGVIYDLDKATGDAYIITNYHVCFSSGVNASDGIATRFTIYTYGSESINLNDIAYLQYYNNDCKTYADIYKYDENGLPIIDYGYGAIDAEYVGGSEQYDIAVLKVSGSEVLKNSDCLEAQVYDSDLVTVGSSAIAVGNPGASGISVTNGIISVDSEYISVTINTDSVVLREFRIDTPVNGGNSGGGLFDNYGRLIGIVNAKTPDSTTYENMGYAIPSNIATRVADSIIDMCDGINRKIKRVFLGVTIQIVDSKGYYDTDNGVMRIKETVQVAKFETDSLAKDIGQEIGDILTSVEIIKDSGTIVIELDRMFQMIDAMLLVREGDCIKFNYTRGGVAGSVTTSSLTSDNFIDIV